MINWQEIQYFNRDEFKYAPGIEPDRSLVYMIDSARRIATANAGRDVVFNITSALRERHAGDTGTHTTGHAVDIACSSSRERYYILEALILAGFKRIGVYDKHLHADTAPYADQSVIWWDVSR